MTRRCLGIVVAVAVGLAPGRAAGQEGAGPVEAGMAALAANQFARALEAFGAVPDSATPDERLTKHGGMALALINMGRANEAGAHVEASNRLAEQIGTDEALVKALNVEGQHANAVKRGDRGLAALTRAAALAERAGATAALRTVYGSLATVHQQLEDYERQAYYNQKAFDLVENPTPAQQFSYHVLRGIALFEMYERDAAEAEFQRALELSAVTGRVRDRAFAVGELSFLYWRFDRDAARALPLSDEAIRLAGEAKAGAMEANWRTNRGNIYRDTGDYARAEADYRESIRSLDAGGLANQTFHIWKNIGQVWRLTGKHREAVGLLERLIAERGQFAAMRHLWQAHMELASAYAALGERARADAAFRAMLEVLEEHRNTAILDTFRTGTLAHALSAYDPYERYMRFLTGAAPPQPALALDVAERARARGFLEALGSVRGAVATRLPAPLLEKEGEIRRAISGVQERLRAGDLAAAERSRLLEELRRAEQARDAFVVSLRVEHPALAEARYPELLDTAAVQATLRPGETVVTFFLAEPQSYRWVLTREHLAFDRIAGQSAIEQHVARLGEQLRAPATGSGAAAAAAALGGLLFGGLSIESERPLVVVPHGALHYVPFEVLPLHGRLLVERHAVSYAPSLNALVHLRRSPANPAPFRVLAVGNPAATGAAAARERDGDVENLSLLGPLPFAELELHAIGRTFRDRTRILSGARANESGLREAGVPQFPVVHFATHGLVSDARPTRSGLLLAPERGEDGLLQMSEIYGLGLRANLVVLSACQTALGREVTGEGLIGLSRAFFYAGARSVVATLWNLNDRFAAEFVQRFYAELNAGHASEEALRRAKVAYVNQPRYSHPFYWSSLVMLGDGTLPLVPEPVPAPRGQLLLAIGLSVAALATANIKRNRSQTTR